jgi:Arc/MetJ family transcription regulator
MAGDSHRGFESHALRSVVHLSATRQREPRLVYTLRSIIYTRDVAKHLIDVDEPALGAARAELGTVTIKDTVNEALRRAAHGRRERLTSALDVLADADFGDRDEAWR